MCMVQHLSSLHTNVKDATLLARAWSLLSALPVFLSPLDPLIYYVCPMNRAHARWPAEGAPS